MISRNAWVNKLKSKFLKVFATMLVFVSQLSINPNLFLEANAIEQVVYITSSNNNPSTNGTAVVVDSGIMINFNSESSILGAKVVITDGFTTGDTLAGTNADYNSNTGVLTFSSTFSTASDLQTAFRSVTFEPASSNTDLTSRNIVFTVGSGLYYDGHYYQSIYESNGISWTTSLSAA